MWWPPARPREIPPLPRSPRAVSGHTAEEGAPPAHARNMLRMAESMLEVARRLRLPTPVPEGQPQLPVRIRIGMHSGEAGGR